MRRPNARLTFLARAAVALVGAASVLSCGSPGDGPGPDPERPNLILLVSDDQGTVLGSYGTAGVQTPHLDALAERGVRFTRAYAPSAVCTPSRTSIYTGLMPAHSGATGFEPVADGVRVWGEYFVEAGYRTGLIGKLGAKPIARFPFDFMARSNKNDEGARSLEWHVGELNRFLDGDDGRPWVLVVNFRDSHWPFPTDGAPFGEDAPGPHAADAVDVPATLVDNARVRGEIASYYDGLRRMDATVGAMLTRLDARGEASDTIGLFTSDNGPPFPYAKTTLYEAGIHMPLIAWNVGRQGTEDALVSLTDILPTFLDYAGADATGLDGRSLLPFFADERSVADWRDAIFATHDSHRVPPDIPSRSVRFGDWKYIRTWGEGLRFQNNVMQTSAAWRAMAEAAATDPSVRALVMRFVERPKEELFHLGTDPAELTNLALDPAHESVLDEARARLAETELVTLPKPL